MKLGWGVSGAGMAARAMFEAHEAGLLETRLAFVILDRATPMVDFCKAKKIVFLVSDPINVDSAIIAAGRAHSLDWLGLTFNRLLSQQVIDEFGGRIFNLHLSLLPLFPGFGATSKALASGMKFAGTTVHLIDSGMDSGQILLQSVCPIERDDNVASLGRRQFFSALCLLLQLVRSIERQEFMLTSGRPVWNGSRASGGSLNPSVDQDLLRFATEYVDRLPIA